MKLNINGLAASLYLLLRRGKKDLNGADVELVRIYYVRSSLKLRGQASEIWTEIQLIAECTE